MVQDSISFDVFHFAGNCWSVFVIKEQLSVFIQFIIYLYQLLYKIGYIWPEPIKKQKNFLVISFFISGGLRLIILLVSGLDPSFESIYPRYLTYKTQNTDSLKLISALLSPNILNTCFK